MTMKSESVHKTSSALVVLFRLIEANDWEKLDDMFLSDANGARTFQRLASLVAKSQSFNGMTVLHACARFSPPPSLVARMLLHCPADASAQDCLHRTPLHVAVGTGANSRLVRVLVDAYPEACMIQDQDGRTPLHMACDSSCELFEDTRSTRRGPPSHNTVGILLSTALDAAVLEDEDGMTAIEYALCSGADLQTVRLIQRAAQKVMLNKQKEERANKAKERGWAKEEAGSKTKNTPAKAFHPSLTMVSARTA